MLEVGTLLRCKNNENLYLITRVIDILKNKKRRTIKLQGYRVSPCDRLDWGFAVLASEMEHRFEVIG
jgi:hypothetical protein